MSCKAELLSLLRKKPREINAVAMPDFFLDRLIDLDCQPSRFSSNVRTIVEHKGGSIDGIRQTDLRGGNAVNTAAALAALGANVTPVVCTDTIGLQQIKFYFKPRRVDLSHAKVLARASLTTALEFKTKSGKANIMLRDVGSLADFGPDNLNEQDYQLIERADYVCLFNWAGTRNHGTELAKTVFSRVKAKGRGKTYFDTADPTPNTRGISDLIDEVLKTPQVDVLSLNENEAITYAEYFEKNITTAKRKTDLGESALECSRILAKHLSARIDLHATNFSATFYKKHEVIMPSFGIQPLRATGAGDAWNAGNILGDANTLSEECRLALANAVSACYLISPEAIHPTRQRLVKFIENCGFPF